MITIAIVAALGALLSVSEVVGLRQEEREAADQIRKTFKREIDSFD